MKLNKLQKINSLNKLFLLGIEKNIFKFKKKIKDFLKEIILNKDEKRKLKQLSLELTDNTINEYLVTIYKYLLNRYPDKECFEIYGNRIRNSEQNGFKEILIDVLESDEFLNRIYLNI